MDDITKQGLINVRAVVDAESIYDRMVDASNNADNKNVYPRGAVTGAHNIINRDVIIGYKESLNKETEEGFASFAGFNKYEDLDEREAFADTFYFVGISKTDVTISDNPVQTSITVTKAGTESLKNNSSAPIFAGDPVMWSPPDPSKFKGGQLTEETKRPVVTLSRFEPELQGYEKIDIMKRIKDNKPNGRAADVKEGLLNQLRAALDFLAGRNLNDVDEDALVLAMIGDAGFNMVHSAMNVYFANRARRIIGTAMSTYAAAGEKFDINISQTNHRF